MYEHGSRKGSFPSYKPLSFHKIQVSPETKTDWFKIRPPLPVHWGGYMLSKNSWTVRSKCCGAPSCITHVVWSLMEHNPKTQANCFLRYVNNSFLLAFMTKHKCLPKLANINLSCCWRLNWRTAWEFFSAHTWQLWKFTMPPLGNTAFSVNSIEEWRKGFFTLLQKPLNASHT